jgi:hypothetical protein
MLELKLVPGTQIKSFTILPLVNNEPTDLVTKLVLLEIWNYSFHEIVKGTCIDSKYKYFI